MTGIGTKQYMKTNKHANDPNNVHKQTRRRYTAGGEKGEGGWYGEVVEGGYLFLLLFVAISLVPPFLVKFLQFAKLSQLQHSQVHTISGKYVTVKIPYTTLLQAQPVFCKIWKVYTENTMFYAGRL